MAEKVDSGSFQNAVVFHSEENMCRACLLLNKNSIYFECEYQQMSITTYVNIHLLGLSGFH